MIKKEKKMLIILGGIVLAILFILYFGFLKKEASIPFYGTPPEIILPELNLDILNDSRFQELKPYGDLPIEVGQTGKDNPYGTN